MKKLIFNFNNYCSYLNYYAENHSDAGRGFKLALSNAINCQPGYITQVFKGKMHLSLEQGDFVNLFLKHTDQESDYFLLLIQLARAGTPRLKKYFQNKCEAIVKQRTELISRIDAPQVLDKENLAIYYSDWLYAFIHIIVSIKEYTHRESIQKVLNLPIERIQEVLDFLQKTGLIYFNQGQYTIGKSRLHINQNSSFLRLHHQNWRIKAIESLNHHFKNDLHYSACVSLSNESYLEIKELLIQNIEHSNKIIDKAPCEELYGWNIDFFKLC